MKSVDNSVDILILPCNIFKLLMINSFHVYSSTILFRTRVCVDQYYCVTTGYIKRKHRFDRCLHFCLQNHRLMKTRYMKCEQVPALWRALIGGHYEKCYFQQVQGHTAN